FSLGPGEDFVVQEQCSTDTGVSWINVPSHIVDAIASRTNAEYQFKDDIYTVGCDATSLPDFTFTAAGGATLTISPDVYLLKIDNKRNVCAVEVYATPFMDGWLIGDTVIRAYCHAHDVGRKRIGFAKSIHSSTPSQS
ncbi:aspartic protease, partial [Aphelenchoides avenae]